MEQSQPETDDSEAIIFVTDHDGREHALPALEGWRVMEVIRDWGIELKAERGGACACATCHVYVDEAWLPRLHPPTEEEVGNMDGSDDDDDDDAGGNKRIKRCKANRLDLDALEGDVP